MMGTAEDYRWWGAKMCIQNQCPVVMVDFRNAPENRTPIGMTDVYTAVKEVYNNPEVY